MEPSTVTNKHTSEVVDKHVSQAKEIDDLMNSIQNICAMNARNKYDYFRSQNAQTVDEDGYLSCESCDGDDSDYDPVCRKGESFVTLRGSRRGLKVTEGHNVLPWYKSLRATKDLDLKGSTEKSNYVGEMCVIDEGVSLPFNFIMSTRSGRSIHFDHEGQTWTPKNDPDSSPLLVLNKRDGRFVIDKLRVGW
jgi:hypothetical protein